MQDNDEGTDFDCTICLELMFEPARLECNHAFCKECILRLKDKFCPLCREKIDQKLKLVVDKELVDEIKEAQPFDYGGKRQTGKKGKNGKKKNKKR